ncbi:MAG: DUF3160 domain-containing protein [Stomatobaculum sp.]|nr:DUF3160 domain-containing protein [Stomatobaculum sp.]
MNSMKRLTACVLTACLSLSLVSCGSLGKPALEKIEEISGGLGLEEPVHEAIQIAEELIPEELLSGLGLGEGGSEAETAEGSSGDEAGETEGSEASDSGAPESSEPAPVVLARVSLRSAEPSYKASADLTPSVPSYDPGADMANVINRDQFSYDHLSAEAKDFLAKNHFFIQHQGANSGFPEFYELYEDNRYWHVPNFVTVDSLMHTYHLYFTVLMKKVEREKLAPTLAYLSRGMLEKSLIQYDALKGTSWENAAFRNVAFFTIGLNLQEAESARDAEVQKVVDTELEKIFNAAGSAPCSLFGASDSFYSGTHDEDYSQYKPRGNYEGDPVLEGYFRAMMWYGRIAFLAEDEDATRSALLITEALRGNEKDAWEAIYAVSSFFAGASDDCLYTDYSAAAEAAWPDGLYVDKLPGDEEGFASFRKNVERLAPPRINSLAHHSGADQNDSGKSFRFMGQRYNMDGEIYERLTEWDPDESKSRIVPDALDVPNVLGSPVAEKLMEEKGDAKIPIYQKELPVLREEIQNTDPALWNSSLYSGWLHTLTPLLAPRPDGYPAFAKSEEWLKKTLETYEGSYTELKHDTVLYAKQVYVAEGDGEGPKDRDDRGYVEPEPEVYARFASLSQDTKDGLDRFSMLDDESEEMLDGLTSLAARLLTISEKELQDQALTDEEYDLIRDYGTIIERYWEAYKLDTYSSGLDRSMQLDASLVTDIASGDRWILQLGTGLAQKMIVLVPVDGTLRFASGTVFSFYEFVNDGERLTDSEWKTLNGFRPGPDSGKARPVDKPDWTMTYRINPYSW